MKKTAVLFLVGMLALAFWGCPYESDYDLGSAMLPQYDKRVIGKWENLTDSSYQFLEIKPYGDEYPDYVEINVSKTRVKDYENYTIDDTYYARFAKVDNLDYLVVEYYDEYDDWIYYYYYQYKVKDANNILLREVNEGFTTEEAPDSSEALLAFFKANQAKPEFLTSEKKYKKY